MSPAPVPGPPAAPSRERLVARCWLLALLAAHFASTVVGWKHEWLPGHEFRQTQTAISALFIQRDRDFSLAYPTPIMGRPWSIPMEFPLYHWAVVALSDATDQPLVTAARTVSLACFYLALPALYLLLGHLGLSPPRRLLTLGLLLATPLYVFYSRAFLIESMALMLSLWFVAAFVPALATGHRGWLVAANVFGVLAGLAKVTTFLTYGLATAAWTVVFLFQHRLSWRTALLRSVPAVAAPLLAAAAWIAYADRLKSLNPGASFLVSSQMGNFNFGPWAQRFSATFWPTLADHWSHMLAPVAATGALLLAGLWAARGRRLLLAAPLALFVGIQLVFANLYFLHDYYLYASGVLLVAALGLACSALLDRLAPRPFLRWTPWLAAAGLAALSFATYRRDLLPMQQLDIPGGGEHTQAVRTLTAPTDVMIVVGEDWSSVLPYYCQRRALMIPNWRVESPAYLDSAFQALRTDRVGVFVLSRKSPQRAALLDRAELLFHIVPVPSFVFKDDLEFYFHEDLHDRVTAHFAADPGAAYNDLTIVRSAPPPSGAALAPGQHEFIVPRLAEQSHFAAMSPTPLVARSPFPEIRSNMVGPDRRFNAHAPTDLVLPVSAGRHRLQARFGLAEETYGHIDSANTDGVRFVAVFRQPGRTRHLIAETYLDPQTRPADRGTQTWDLEFTAEHDGELLLQTDPGTSGSAAYDWAYWTRIDVQPLPPIPAPAP